MMWEEVRWRLGWAAGGKAEEDPIKRACMVTQWSGQAWDSKMVCVCVGGAAPPEPRVSAGRGKESAQTMGTRQFRCSKKARRGKQWEVEGESEGLTGVAP